MPTTHRDTSGLFVISAGETIRDTVARVGLRPIRHRDTSARFALGAFYRHTGARVAIGPAVVAGPAGIFASTLSTVVSTL